MVDSFVFSVIITAVFAIKAIRLISLFLGVHLMWTGEHDIVQFACWIEQFPSDLYRTMSHPTKLLLTFVCERAVLCIQLRHYFIIIWHLALSQRLPRESLEGLHFRP